MKAGPHKVKSRAIAADASEILFPKIKNPDTIAQIIERTQFWTNNHLCLTPLIYHYVAQYSAQIISAERANIVDEIVCQKILKQWRHNDAAPLLNRIEQAFLNFEPQDTLLILYFQILWREGIAIGAQPKLQAEKTALLNSGLIHTQNGQLKLSNRIFATVFNLDWIEQQRPGLTTRTVTVSAPASAQSAHPPRKSRRSLAKSVTIAASILGGLMLLGLTAAPHIQENHRLSATAQTLTPTGLNLRSSLGGASSSQPKLFSLTNSNQQTHSNQPNQLQSSRRLQPKKHSYPRHPKQHLQKHPEKHTQKHFEDRPEERLKQGIEHATNGRWLPMMQQFCSIPPNAAELATAQEKLALWVSLFGDDIRQANTTLLTTQKEPCDLVETALQGKHTGSMQKTLE